MENGFGRSLTLPEIPEIRVRRILTSFLLHGQNWVEQFLRWCQTNASSCIRTDPSQSVVSTPLPLFCFLRLALGCPISVPLARHARRKPFLFPDSTDIRRI